MGERRLRAAVVEWLAIASASAAVACLIGWGASIATPKAAFSMFLTSEFGLSVSDGALEFGHGLFILREIESCERQGNTFYSVKPRLRLPGLRHWSGLLASPRPVPLAYVFITKVSLLYATALFGVAAWLLVRSYRRITRPNSSIVLL